MIVTSDIERRLTAKEVSEILGFTTTNLKYYASQLELNGLKIFRNTRDHREYTQTDVNILLAMQYLNREKSMVLEEAASFVMSADTDIDAILAIMSPETVATIDPTIPVVTHNGDSEGRVVAQAMTVIGALREELHNRDKLMIEFQSAIDDKLAEQTKQLAEQAEIIAKLSEQLAEMDRRQQEKPEPSLWTRIFGK